ncbi:SRPBCC family protein [Chryseolinea soli]|uniref:SRPBCC domain-containing protein n=1 Tax=Chryseolinea soli TaxID=2321403 RepID=A0A385SWG1_9BACT|nr:SRPBCC domain-containing protein [Chryseolinea soli]AYB34060.1 SRPBCC domain-containing protein [Chryseolinea soli]
MPDKFSTTVTINSEPAEVWSALIDPDRMTKWMGEADMGIEVHTDWKIEAPILIRGFHHVKFENKGRVLKYEKERRLSYSHLSSVSRLPDKQENYSILEFILTPIGNHTTLALSIENFPTETIQKHLEFYWKTTMLAIKENVESR